MALETVSITLRDGVTTLAALSHVEAIAVLIDELNDLYQGISEALPANVDGVPFTTTATAQTALTSNPLQSNNYNASTKLQSVTLNLPLDMSVSAGKLALSSRLTFGTDA